jgi:hypothetical protein
MTTQQTEHPTLKLFDIPLVTTDGGSFEDMAHVVTPLGTVGFTRIAGSTQDRWGWNLVTVMRAEDDFDDVVGGPDARSGPYARSLEQAVKNARRTLEPLYMAAIANKDTFAAVRAEGYAAGAKGERHHTTRALASHDGAHLQAVELRRLLDEALLRNRSATQAIIDAIGSTGAPESLESAVSRIVAKVSGPT